MADRGEVVVRVGSGWRGRVAQGQVWLVEGHKFDEARQENVALLARWFRPGEGAALVRTTVEPAPLVRDMIAGTDDWLQVSDAEVEELTRQITALAPDIGASMTEAARRERESIEGSEKAQREAAARVDRLSESVTAPSTEPSSGWSLFRSRASLVAPPPPAPSNDGVVWVNTDASGPHATEFPAPHRANAPFEERAGLVPRRVVEYPHMYPGAPGFDPDNPGDSFTSDCSYDCGAWCGPSRSGSRDGSGVDPFGECPEHRKQALAGTPLVTDKHELCRVNGEVLMRSVVPKGDPGAPWTFEPGQQPVGEVELRVNGAPVLRGVWPDLKPVVEEGRDWPGALRDRASILQIAAQELLELAAELDKATTGR